MEKKQPTNAFQEVHKRSQAFRDNMRKASQKATVVREKEAEEEARREGFDRATTDTPAPADDERTQ